MSLPKTENTVWHASEVERADRWRASGGSGVTLWLTGLSGSGKSTIAVELERQLVAAGRAAYLLDGDNLRHGLNGDLGFSPEDRTENIRRVGELASLFFRQGSIVLCTFVSPFQQDRERARGLVPDGRFVEVFVDTPLEECERRDVKGLYAKARAGEIAHMTGISSPYESPEEPEVRIETTGRELDEVVAELMVRLRDLGLVR